MNHTFIRDGANTFIPDLEYMQEHFPSIERVLGEDGRYTDTQNSLNPSEGIFGSALWTTDYLLYTMSLVRFICISYNTSACLGRYLSG